MIEATLPRCYIPLLRNAPDHLPRKADDDCLQEMHAGSLTADSIEEDRQPTRRIDCRMGGARLPQARPLGRGNDRGNPLTLYRLPRQHHKHLKSTNMLERLNEEIQQKTRVVRNLPQCRGLHETGASPSCRDPQKLAGSHRYLNMNDLSDHKKGQLRQAT